RNYQSAAERSQDGPLLVPIRTPSGEALLDLTHAAVDLRALRQIARRRALRRGDFKHILVDGPAYDGLYVLEERYLDPGEAIYVAGQVQRMEASTAEGG